MDLSRMLNGIIRMINKKYPDNVEEECLDIVQLKNICNLYKPKNVNNDVQFSSSSSVLETFNLSSPKFTKPIKKSSNAKSNAKSATKSSENNLKNKMKILKSDIFQKKYIFFVRIIYCCLKMNVQIMDDDSDLITLKNNYQLIKSIENKKKKIITDHINILHLQCKNITTSIGPDYDSYVRKYLVKIKILDKVIYSIKKLINAEVLELTDNLFSLILPYFYTYTVYIEEYNI